MEEGQALRVKAYRTVLDEGPQDPLSLTKGFDGDEYTLAPDWQNRRFCRREAAPQAESAAIRETPKTTPEGDISPSRPEEQRKTS
jgi:hypothetical protein